MADIGEAGSLPLDLKPNLLDECFWQNLNAVGKLNPWDEIVRIYSKRKLTNRADKLCALGGVVQDVENRFGKEYFVGLWKDDIVRGLSWYQQPSRTDPNETLSWSGLDICPTFSWIKVDGEVRFQVEQSSEVTIDDLGITQNEVVGSRPRQRLRISAFIKITGPVSRFLALDIIKEFGVFTFHTRPRHAENMIWADGSSTNPFIEREYVDNERTSPLFGRSATTERITLPTNLRFLELSRGRGLRGLEQSLGLVLVPHDDSNVEYYRIGFFAVSLERELQDGFGFSRRTKNGPGSGDIPTCMTEFGRRWTNSLRQETLVLI